MKRKTTHFLLLYFLFTSRLLLAQVSLPLATNLTKAYERHTRSLTGSPGKSYWQNSADYQIELTFDPATRQLEGEMTIAYQNNSPDTLKQLVFKLYPNLYQQQSMRNTVVAAEDLSQGVEIKSVQLAGQSINLKSLIIRGTNMYLRGTQILPGKQTHLKISYAYRLNKGSFIRTGQVDSGAFVIAYFFPRIAVYDDLDGWNEYPYLGKEEFYNDFCNFKVAITLPGTYQCWATGTLQNLEEVYEPKIRKRIEVSVNSDAITDIITEDDLATETITLKNPRNT